MSSLWGRPPECGPPRSTPWPSGSASSRSRSSNRGRIHVHQSDAVGGPSGRSGLRESTDQVVRFVQYLSIPVAIVLGFLAGPTVEAWLGPLYREAAPVIGLLCLAGVVQAWALAIRTAICGSGRPRSPPSSTAPKPSSTWASASCSPPLWRPGYGRGGTDRRRADGGNAHHSARLPPTRRFLSPPGAARGADVGLASLVTGALAWVVGRGGGPLYVFTETHGRIAGLTAVAGAGLGLLIVFYALLLVCLPSSQASAGRRPEPARRRSFRGTCSLGCVRGGVEQGFEALAVGALGTRRVEVACGDAGAHAGGWRLVGRLLARVRPSARCSRGSTRPRRYRGGRRSPVSEHGTRISVFIARAAGPGAPVGRGGLGGAPGRLRGDGRLRWDLDGPPSRAGMAEWCAARHCVRACAGRARVAVVGLRIGATLAAAELARGGEVDDLVLWDPHATGRAFLREQRAFWAFLRSQAMEWGLLGEGEQWGSGGVVDDGAMEGPGVVFSAETVAALEPLTIDPGDRRLASRELVLARRGQEAQPRAGGAVVVALRRDRRGSKGRTPSST